MKGAISHITSCFIIPYHILFHSSISHPVSLFHVISTMIWAISSQQRSFHRSNDKIITHLATRDLLREAKHMWISSLSCPKCPPLRGAPKQSIPYIDPPVHCYLHRAVLCTVMGSRLPKRIHIQVCELVQTDTKVTCQAMCAFHLMASHVTSQLARGPTRNTGYITHQL